MPPGRRALTRTPGPAVGGAGPADCDPASVASYQPDPGAPRFARETPEFDRALAFFEGTYAVALTLLVTTLDGTDMPGAWANPAALWAAIGT